VEEPLKQLISAAKSFDWIEVKNPVPGDETISAKLKLRLPDGDEVRYHVSVSYPVGGRRDRLSVEESGEARLLPRGCPERHINRDGTFCLGWGSSLPPLPTSGETAERWWKTLGGFLEDQNRASLTGKWRKGGGWAHGEAAQYQAGSEAMEPALPEGVRKAISSGALALTIHGDRLERRRTPCPCGSGIMMKVCCEGKAVEYLGLRRKMLEAEKDFQKNWEDFVCCRTMVTCPLLGGR
jgi:hypothetical protein